MERKQLPADFKDFIQCLNLNKVKYLLVGGFGSSPIKIDIINEADGINIEDCYPRKK